jgi:hypothetical protein
MEPLRSVNSRQLSYGRRYISQNGQGCWRPAERSCEALVSFRDSSGSHYSLHACVATRKTDACTVRAPRKCMEHPTTHPFYHSTPACARAPAPLAPTRPIPCPTQRTHAIGLWVARRNPILCERSFLGLGKGYITKDPLNSAFPIGVCLVVIRATLFV